MRNQVHLWLVVAVLVCVTAWAGYGQGEKRSPARQNWDYKWISVGRGVGTLQWSIWVEDDKQLAPPVSIAAKINELGEQGWELVTVTPVSNHGGTTDSAGYTSQMTYFLKRPK